MPTLADIEHMLAQTRHTSKYNIRRHALLLHMRYVQGMTPKEIAAFTHRSIGAVNGILRSDVYRLLHAYNIPDDNKTWLPTPKSMRRRQTT